MRCSTREQARSGLGLAAQRDVITAEAARRGWVLTALHEEVASGGRADRPVLRQVIDGLRPGDVLAVARLDRLTRSLLDFAGIVREAQSQGWSLAVLDQDFDLGTASGRAMAGMLAVFAEYERELIRARITEAMRALPRERRGGPCYSEAVRAKAQRLRDGGLTLKAVAVELERQGIRPARGGKKLHASTVARILAAPTGGTEKD
jgi:DNA invertase Pin-like site-specific DNA recombinase